MTGLALAVAAVLAAAAPASPEAPAQPAAPVDLGRFRLVDLSHAFDAATLYWPMQPRASS